MQRAYAKALQREEGWSSPVHNTDQLFKPLFSLVSLSFTCICISSFQDGHFKMSFKFLCSSCIKQKWKRWQLQPKNLWSASHSPSYHTPSTEPADKTNPHPIHKIVFLSSQERLKQGRQISAPENHLVLQQQRKAKGHMILVQQSGTYCFCSHSSYTFIPRILSLQTTAQALSVPTPKLSVISCLLQATGWKWEKHLLSACSFAAVVTPLTSSQKERTASTGRVILPKVQVKAGRWNPISSL